MILDRFLSPDRSLAVEISQPPGAMWVVEVVFRADTRRQTLPIVIDAPEKAQVLIDKQDAGLELLKRGLCWVVPEEYVSEAPAEIQTSYSTAQAAAQSDRLGLWQEP